MKLLLKKPSAWVPIVLSLTALLTMLISFAVSGAPTPQADEGTAAHLFQIWLVLEVIMIGFFFVKWLPRQPKETFLILAMQIIAVLLVCAPVRYFGL